MTPPDPAAGAALDADVAILGAGPAGLAAALELAEAGRRVLVIEASDGAGGLCRSHERRGFWFDQGGHRFITRDRDLFERVRGLLGEDLRVRERQSVIRIDGREYRYPLDLGEVLRGEGAGGVLRILASYLWARGRRWATGGGDGDSLEDWVRGRFGGAVFDRFFRDYTRKLWGIGAGELSGDWAARRISPLRLGDVIRNALGRERRRPRTFAVRYAYPRHGIGQIFRVMAERIEALGGRIICNARPLCIRPRSGLTFVGPAGEVEVRCADVISTIPLPDLLACLDAPAPVREAADGLGCRALRFLNLLLDGPHSSDRTWIYVPEKRYLMTRIQFPANRSPDNCPPGRTSIQLEIPCQPGDALWSASDAELVERSEKDLDAMGLSIAGRLLDAFSIRAAHAYPIYRHGYKERVDRVLGWVRSIHGLQSCGRQGEFSYIFFDRAMERGIDAACRVLGRPPRGAPDETEPLLPEEAASVAGEA